MNTLSKYIGALSIAVLIGSSHIEASAPYTVKKKALTQLFGLKTDDAKRARILGSRFQNSLNLDELRNYLCEINIRKALHLVKADTANLGDFKDSFDEAQTISNDVKGDLSKDLAEDISDFKTDVWNKLRELKKADLRVEFHVAMARLDASRMRKTNINKMVNVVSKDIFNHTWNDFINATTEPVGAKAYIDAANEDVFDWDDIYGWQWTQGQVIYSDATHTLDATLDVDKPVIKAKKGQELVLVVTKDKDATCASAPVLEWDDSDKCWNWAKAQNIYGYFTHTLDDSDPDKPAVYELGGAEIKIQAKPILPNSPANEQPRIAVADGAPVLDWNNLLGWQWAKGQNIYSSTTHTLDSTNVNAPVVVEKAGGANVDLKAKPLPPLSTLTRVAVADDEDVLEWDDAHGWQWAKGQATYSDATHKLDATLDVNNPEVTLNVDNSKVALKEKAPPAPPAPPVVQAYVSEYGNTDVIVWNTGNFAWEWAPGQTTYSNAAYTFDDTDTNNPEVTLNADGSKVDIKEKVAPSTAPTGVKTYVTASGSKVIEWDNAVGWKWAKAQTTYSDTDYRINGTLVNEPLVSKIDGTKLTLHEKKVTPKPIPTNTTPNKKGNESSWKRNVVVATLATVIAYYIYAHRTKSDSTAAASVKAA